MITYRYGPYKPDDDQPWDLDRLMSILSEMIMKYDIQLEEALRMLIDRGLPVNLFLKEGGMEDLINGFMRQIDERMNVVLKNYTLEGALREAKKDLENTRYDLTQNLDTSGISDEFKKKYILENSQLDQLLRMKWDLHRETSDRNILKSMDRMIQNAEDFNIIETGSKKYLFQGKENLTKKEALEILKEFEEMDEIKESLRRAVDNGELFNFNMEQLARYLGPESYQEFMERRESILEKLGQLLKENGKVVQNGEDGNWKLSPASIRKIGRRALEEVFSNLKSDNSSGSHDTDETGESENVSSATRPFEFGDSAGHIDIPGSIINSLIRRGSKKPGLIDLNTFVPRGTAKSSTVILLDLSGSMMREDRFYNAKKVVLALDSLIREQYRDDMLSIVGFGSLAKSYNAAEIPELQPFPVTIYNPHIRLRFDFNKIDEKTKEKLPLYFTNLQRGLQLSRKLLGSGETKNKQIILITDGVPTAHFEESVLCVNYPPSPADFETALREVRGCSDEGIIINTFLLTSDWEMSYFGEESFISQFAKQSMGRIFYPRPGELNQFVVMDFVGNKKSIIQY